MNDDTRAIQTVVKEPVMLAAGTWRWAARHRAMGIPAILIAALALGGCHGAPGRKGLSEITAREVRAKLDSQAPVLLVFACPGNTFSKARIEGAISVEDFRPMIPSLPRDAEIILYCACAGDKAAHTLAAELSSAGFTDVAMLPGGIYAWIRAGYDLAPLEPVGILPLHQEE
jgi:rhodanese-related sulfurtransferase